MNARDRLALLVAVFGLAGLAGCAAASARGRSSASSVPSFKGVRLVDMTHPFDEKTLYWPTAKTGFVRETVSYGKTPGGYFYSAYSFCAPEHGGTHLDAPIHFAEGKTTADAIPLDRLLAPAVVVDVSSSVAKDVDYLITQGDIDAFEKQHGAIDAGTMVFFRTGFEARWPDKKQYLGDDTPGDTSKLHFPGIGEDAAKALVARKVAAIGIDTASLDHGPSKNFIAHQIILGADIPAFENVASLAQLPARGASVIALPMKIAGGSGGPVRIVALLPAP